MKKTVTLLFFIFLYHTGFSQAWKELTPLTSGYYSRCGSFAISDTGYVIEGSYQNNTYGYDTAAPHNWTKVTNYPLDNTDGTVGSSLNGIGYAGTGAAGGYQFNNSFYQYVPGPGGGTWTQLPNVPGLQRAYGVAFTLDGKVYVGGGLYNYYGSITPLNDFYGYDPVTSKWDTIAPCPALGISCDAAAFVIGDTAYVGTGGLLNGSGQSVPQKDFWKYDTTSKTWTEISSLPGKQRAEASAFATCDKGYVGLGYINIPRDTDADDFWQYDPSSDTWASIGNFAGGARNGASAFVIGKVGYIAGGSTTTGTYLNDLWRYEAVAIPAFSADTSVCAGGSITFTDTSNFFPDHWLWQFPGGKPDTSSSKSVSVEYDTVGTHNVILTAWNSCDSGSQTFTNYITVNPGPTVTVTPDAPSVCNGQKIQLTASGGTSYQWVGTSDNTDSITVSPSQDTTYELRVTSGICTTDTFISVKENNAPPLIIQPQTPSVCPGQSVTLTVPVSGTGYKWSPVSTLSPSTGDSVSASPLTQTTYTVTGIDSLGCSVTDSDVVSISTAPNKPTITQNGDILSSSATQGNQWVRNDTALTGATNETYIATISGWYQVIAANPANGCSTTSDSIDITTGINQLKVESGQVTVFPNPTGGEINVNIGASAMDVKDWNLEITDVLGRTLLTKSSLSYSNDIDLSKLASGVYFISVIYKTGRVVVPVVRQ